MPLTSTEYEKYKKAVSTLMDINKNLDLFKVVFYNFKDYELTLNHSFKQYIENPAMDWSRMDRTILELNRRISNYLSSVRIFLDHSEYTIKKTYGKKSSIVKEFKDTCSNAYDNNFSYRFLYKLRNYVQHCGMPLGSININSQVVNTNPTKVSHRLELQFDRDLLLKKFNWKKLEPEIKKLPSKFDINPHINAMNESIGDITYALIKNDLPDGIKCSEHLKKMILEAMEYGKAEGTPCILDVNEINENDLNISMNWFPLHVIQWIDYFSDKSFIKLNVVYDSSNLTKIVENKDRLSNLNKGDDGTLYLYSRGL